jgi:hypothetical protein
MNAMLMRRRFTKVRENMLRGLKELVENPLPSARRIQTPGTPASASGL